jgi:replicative superfamily II helicase
MVDFKKLRAGKAKPRPINPREIFHSLPKPVGINDLYASQAEVLDTWYGQRNDKDVVVKLHTGGGKTLVALLMAQSTINETSQPVLYLTPTNQLVGQVLAKSREYGIPAVPYVKKQPLPAEFEDGKAVLVGAYETLFSGRSKFGVRGSNKQPVKVGAIILDDAHVALSNVRRSFTLTIEAKKHKSVYQEFAGRFRPAFRDVGRLGSFDDVTSGKDFGVIEVPSWAWQRKLPEIQDLLATVVDGINDFVWPFLRDNLAVCHCLFSRSAVTITPIFPAVDLLPTFADCPRRIYMSATIADDSEIVRTFDASVAAVSKPISSASLAGVGERMILVPGLMKLSAIPITNLVKHIAVDIAKGKAGVAVLVPSGEAAQKWEDVAQYPRTTGEVAHFVREMQDGTLFGPVVMANRYDGIDLAGNSCRLLVMDGLPQGTSDYDMYRMNVMANSSVNSLLAQRVEQGIGRGTRGGADYCVVILTGDKLVGWIGRKVNLDQLTASTRAQLKMGQEVSEQVTKSTEVLPTVMKCLDRDPDWVAYHASELAEAAHAAPVDELALRIAGGERKAFHQQRMGQYEPALATLEKLIADPEVAKDTERTAWLSASAARIAHQLGNDAHGQRLQTNAFSVNNNHCPPKQRPQYVPRPRPGKQSEAIVMRLMKYERRGSLLADFEDAIADLVLHASPRRYEQALTNLGSYLGFEADRPEQIYGIGPDVLWRTDAPFDFIIEAKHEKQDDNPLYKRDHAQLLEAEQWFKATYPGRESVRVSALPEPVADQKATPAGTFALRLADVTRLAGAVREVLTDMTVAPGDEAALREKCEELLLKGKLKPEGIKNSFLKPFANGAAR